MTVAGIMRRCVACRTERPKAEMLRAVRGTDGVVAVDATGRMQGRGAYICSNPECLRTAAKKRALSRALKRQVADDIYAVMETLCSEGGNEGGQ